MKKIFMLILVTVFMMSLFAISVSAADETSYATTSEPTTNIYYIIEGMWQYFLPSNVIADNSPTIAFYTITLTVLFALCPFIILFKFLFRRK